MSTSQITLRSAQASPRFRAGIAVAFYVVTIVTGVVVLLVGGKMGFVVDVIASVFYIAVTVLFYVLTKGV